MANMTFKANILPATSQECNLGSPTQQWTVYGPIHSNGIYGTENVDYGSTLPASAVPGQLFFQTSNTVIYSVPAGGSAGYALIKNTNSDGDFSWQQVAHETYSILTAQQNGTSASLVTTGDKYNWNNKGTVQSVQVGATSPVVSSNVTTATTNFTTTISLADAYGDTKNPYGSKTKNYVLAAPSNANGIPSFRQLGLSELSGADDVKAIEALSGTTGLLKKTAANTWTLDTSSYVTSSGVTQLTAGAGLNTTSNDTATDGGTITTTGTLYLTKSGVTAATYGSTTAQTPDHGDTFDIPYFTVDKYGRVTSASATTVQLPQMDFSSADFLPLAGGTMSGAIATHGIIGALNIDYGDTLPASATDSFRQVVLLFIVFLQVVRQDRL